MGLHPYINKGGLLEFNELIKRCIRILHISRKPTNSEYEHMAKITGIGMLVLGVLGLIISLMFGLF